MNEMPGAILREVSRLFSLVQRTQVACCDGTTLTQCHILTELGRDGPMTLANLRANLSLDKGWLSRAVDGLAVEGLVSKESSNTDRRTVQLELTEEGEKRYAALNQVLDEHADRILSRIPEEERASVLRALGLLQSALRAEVILGTSRPESGCCCRTNSCRS